MDWRVVKFLTQFQYEISEKSLSSDEKIRLIKDAIKSKSNLSVVYLKSNDQKSKRVTAPKRAGTTEYMQKSYLGVEGYCFKRQDDRVFRIDRILELEVMK
jgi:predicted DNA-binding transcriptional regulator YafY